MKNVKIMLAGALLVCNFAAFADTDADLTTKATGAVQNTGSWPNVTVTTNNGAVTLGGNVASKDEAANAEKAVREALKDVKDAKGNEVIVTNSLKVGK